MMEVYFQNKNNYASMLRVYHINTKNTHRVYLSEPYNHFENLWLYQTSIIQSENYSI